MFKMLTAAILGRKDYTPVQQQGHPTCHLVTDFWKVKFFDTKGDERTRTLSSSPFAHTPTPLIHLHYNPSRDSYQLIDPRNLARGYHPPYIMREVIEGAIRQYVNNGTYEHLMTDDCKREVIELLTKRLDEAKTGTTDLAHMAGIIYHHREDVRQAAAYFGYYPEVMLLDSVPVREALAMGGYKPELMAKDDVMSVRKAVAESRNLPLSVVQDLITNNSHSENLHLTLLENGAPVELFKNSTHTVVLFWLAEHGHFVEEMADNRHTPKEVQMILAGFPSVAYKMLRSEHHQVRNEARMTLRSCDPKHWAEK